MSRGGRGGFRGGKSGLSERLGIVVDEDTQRLINVNPSETFPPIHLPIPDALSDTERSSIASYRLLRARLHDSPLYCLLDKTARVSKPDARSAEVQLRQAAFFDPFEGQATYTQRYRRRRDDLPSLKKFTFVKENFPEELWAAMNDESGVVRKRAAIPSATKRPGADKEELDEWEKQQQRLEEERKARAQGKDVDKDKDEDEAAQQEEEQEAGEGDPDQFDEDEESDNDDYNAEQYFSGGEDDDVGDDGGGGGGGDDDY